VEETDILLPAPGMRPGQQDPLPLPSATRRRLPGLEALRCVAALCVLALHLRAVFGGRYVFGRGYLGVDFFLMLSGYLMARTQEARLAAGASPWGFLLRRYGRLWPLMALGSLPGVWVQALALGVVSAAVWWRYALTATLNLLLLPDMQTYFAFPINIPAWTIFFELVMNALHVLLFWRLRGGWLALVLAALLPVVVGMALRNNGLDVGARPETFLLGGLRVGFAYLIGVALYRWWRDVPVLPVPPLLAIALMPALLPLLFALRIWSWWPDVAFVLLVGPLMIAGALRLAPQGAPARWSTLAGQLAFPLFAFQMPILQGFHDQSWGYWPAAAAVLAVGVSGACILAWLAARKGTAA